MVDSGVYPSDGESRAPRKHKSEQSTNHINTRSSHYSAQNGYTSERTPNRSHHERSQNRHQERDEYRGDRRQNRHQKDRSQVQHPEREKHYGDREQNRSRDEYKERDKSYNDRGHSRHEADRSRNRYEEKDIYYKQSLPSGYEERNNHHKERSRNQFDERERHEERYVQSVDHHGLSVNKKHTEHYSSERSLPQNGAELLEMEYYEAESEGGILDCHKCKYLCTGRACCQLVEVLLNMLILICCSVSYSSTGGYTGISNLGGIYYYQFGGAYNGFSGADGEKAQELDLKFYNLKLPTVTASMAFGGALMTFSCLMVLLGVLRVPWLWPIWLLVECMLDLAIAVGYMPALYFYFKHLQDAYNSEVCKEREALYSSKGYQGFTCALHGADIAAALCACIAIIAFFMSAFFAIKGFQTVRRQKKKPVNTLEF
ncbi:MARVEL domain-containing protein 3 isoform X1 [Hyla sarda]|uniref:MARVEL domain-containing protein 3 isoform X1 n=1 Tax=Hyla sarda TaxID=327740 RepID=UPI0024C2753B|nr:MARVEL domain-containing protein 3 isoform X1 [Hyla sarda]